MIDTSTASEERDPYEIKLEVFEGPLDLLLYLIRKDELDVYDISIAHITAHYLGFLNQIPRLDIEQAGDFILMAATLMRVKSQMLLPREVEPGNPEGEEDPRQELIRRLLEYQQFKEIAEWLVEQGIEQRDIFPSGVPAVENDLSVEVVHPVSLFDLLNAYKNALDHVPGTVVHRIIEEQVSIEGCIELVLEALEKNERLRFFGLVDGRGKNALVATFVGVLELLKSQRIRVQQAKPFDEIWIERRTDGEGGLAGPVAAAIDGQSRHSATDVKEELAEENTSSADQEGDGDGGSGFRFA